MAGDADGTQGQISLVLRNVAPLSFPSLSVDAVGGGGAVWGSLVPDGSEEG